MFSPALGRIRSESVLTVTLELPNNHRVPVTWLRQNAAAPIRWRTVRDILPPGSATPDDIATLRAELHQEKTVTQVLKRQKVDGVWGGNILGVSPSKAQGIRDVGTVARYRHLLELGVPSGERAYRLADRVFFRLLSRDADPKLLFEYHAAAKTNQALGGWARDAIQQGVTAALAQSGQIDDPRVRGAAHRIATGVSQFLRSEVAEKAIIRSGSRQVLHPDAYPPTIFSVAVVAYMPNLQRERAGYVDRLAHYLAQQPPKKSYVIMLGRKVIKPTFHLLGDPIKADSSGNCADLPLALHWIELLVRMGVLDRAPTAQRVLARLLRDCDDLGVWSPRNLRALPKSPSKLADFAFPLEPQGRTMESRQADVTFRLALIAKLAGWQLEYV
jgi:hypothetical protein